MATQICPQCAADAFTWTMQDDQPAEPETVWHCYACGFYAFEDEKYNLDGSYRLEPFTVGCSSCATVSAIKLRRDGKEYLWCGTCALLTEQPAN